MTTPLIMLVTIGDDIPPPVDLSVKTELPEPIRGATYSGFAIPEGGTPPYTYAIISGAIPAGMSFNTSTGEFTGTPTTQGFYEFEVEVTDALSVVFSILFSLTVKGGIVFETTEVPVGEHAVPYSTVLVATGGTGPYTYGVQAGSLPSGFGLTTSGANAGLLAAATPSATTVVTRTIFTIRATDSVGNFGDHQFTVYIWPAIQIISSGASVDGLVGLPYDFYRNSRFGNFDVGLYGLARPTLSWSITSGALPDGLTLNPLSGHITGTPTAVGEFSYDLTVTDSIGGTATDSIVSYVYSVSDIDRIFSDSFGDGTSTHFTIVHNLNLYYPKSVLVIDGLTSPAEPVGVTWQQVDQDTITIDTATIPSTNQYLVIVSG